MLGNAPDGWEEEAAVQDALARLVEEAGGLRFPALYALNVGGADPVLVADGANLRVSAVERRTVLGRLISDVLVTCVGRGGATRDFALVVWKDHPLDARNRAAAEEAGLDVVGVFLGASEADGVPSDAQLRLLLAQDDPRKMWLVNAKRAMVEEQLRQGTFPGQEPVRQRGETAAGEFGQGRCSHAWEPLTTLKRHAATEERVWVEGKGTRAVYVCNVCQAQVEDAKDADNHLWMEQILNGHPECSMDQRVMTEDGHFETKRIPAWEETVVTGYWCPLCGAQKQA